MTILKPWMQVALALALGFGLGLLTHGARAANVELKWTISVSEEVLAVCEESGTASFICHMKYASTEAMAVSLAQSQLVACTESQRPECPAIVAYIRTRWGY